VASKPGAAGAAKQLCSLEFVSGLDRERAWALYLDDLRAARDFIHSNLFDPLKM
jgi:hypothetical protein